MALTGLLLAETQIHDDPLLQGCVPDNHEARRAPNFGARLVEIKVANVTHFAHRMRCGEIGRGLGESGLVHLNLREVERHVIDVVRRVESICVLLSSERTLSLRRQVLVDTDGLNTGPIAPVESMIRTKEDHVNFLVVTTHLPYPALPYSMLTFC